MRLTLALLFVSILTCRGNELAIGRWEGSVKIPERELKLIVDLAQDSGGAWIGSIIIPGLDVKGAALGDIAVTGSEVSFAIKNALGAQRAGPAKFKARATNATLVGDFMQGGNTAPFTLKKNRSAASRTSSSKYADRQRTRRRMEGRIRTLRLRSPCHSQARQSRH